jgi:hypothetical protein
MTWWGIICDYQVSLREFLGTVVNLFTWHNTSTVNRKHCSMKILSIESFCPQKTHNRMLLFGSTLLKLVCHFDYWNQPWTCASATCHEARLCCYLMIHRKHVMSITAVLLQFVTMCLSLYWRQCILKIWIPTN